MTDLVSLADTEAYLGITNGVSAQVDTDVQRLLSAVSAEMRRIARQGFEGAPAIYDEIYQLNKEPGARPSLVERTIWLRHIPVDVVLSIRAIYWDNTQDEILAMDDVAGGFATTLAADAPAGSTNLKVASVATAAIGGLLRVGPDATREIVRTTAVGTPGSGGTGLTIEPPLPTGSFSGDPVVAVSGSAYWHLEDATLGRLVLNHPRPAYGRLAFFRPPEHVRIVLRTPGDIPVDVQQAALDWISDRWTSKTSGVGPRVTSRTIGKWAETYRLGPPPPDVTRVLVGYARPGGGPI